MENRRNSGSYSSRIANNAPPQPVTEGYPQKRNSYRRPAELQPARPQSDLPPASSTNPPTSNTARPVAAGASGQNGVARASSHRRRQSQQIPPPTSGAVAEPLPAAPDVPRGPPPTAYRDPYAPRGSSRPTRTYSGRSRDPTIHLNASRQQPNIQLPPQRLQELRGAPLSPAEPMSATIEGAAKTDLRRPSVPDRSPLQKLEGKLDDISKEERRARILEAELAAQEKAEAERAARRAREAAQKQQRNVSGPVSSSERNSLAPPGRTASTRRHVSMPTQGVSKEPEEDEEPAMYDLTPPWDPTAPAAPAPAPAPASQSRDQRYSAGVTSSGSQRQNKRLSQVDGTVGRTPSKKGKEPVDLNRGSSFRDRAGGVRGLDSSGQPTTQRVDRKPVPSPAGLGLYGINDGPTASRQAGLGVSRFDSKRIVKDLPPTPHDSSSSTGTDRRRDTRGILAAQREMEQEQTHAAQFGTQPRQHPPPLTSAPPAPPPGGYGRVGFVSSAPKTHPTDPQGSQQHRHHVSDMFGHHQDPDRTYVAPPMLNEWRSAPVATLAAEDLDLDTPEPSGGAKPAWWEESSSSRRRKSSSYAQNMTTYDGYVDEPSGQTSFNPPLYLKCGPLLRYTGIRRDASKIGREREIWRGSIMIVTEDLKSSYDKPPTLRLFKQPMDLLPPPPAEVDAEGQHLNPAYVDPIEGQIKTSRTGKTLYVKPIEEIVEGEDLSRVEDDRGLFQETRITTDLNGPNPDKRSRIRKKDGEKIGKVREVPGIRLHAERGFTFWRFNLEVELGSAQARIAYRINRGPAIGFWVPAQGETMNIMFHSCNGFSMTVDSKEFCGPDPMWRDVLNNHQTRPFHVMIGGGDQIYNDAAMRETTLFRAWTESRNPLQKHSTPFSSEMQNELEQFYLDRYAMWFSQGLFGMANSQIPMINIWDDHDIIDGYGSYPHHFMETAVFTGLGAIAFKYYMLFQHQSVVAETEKTEPSWVLGAHPGPYIKEQSRSVFVNLGRQVAFMGIDCRTERQRDEIMTEDSYDVIFDRLEAEIIKGETKHLLVLLGVPIAYPRLNFLENIFTSRLMDPIKALGRAGLLGNFVNKFDGGVEILDDLDDHWTAKHHKEERNWFIRELQHIASTKSVRVTILGGDVHLAAIGEFFTNKKLNIPKDKDHRYMPNVISSAIVNTPPPEMMADVLNKRNKIHHLDPFTDEDMIPIFTHDVDGKKRNNNHLLPRRNWCSLREYKPGGSPPPTPSEPPSPGTGRRPSLGRRLSDSTPGQMMRRMSTNRQRGRDRGPPVSYHNNPAYAAADEAQIPHSSFSPEPPEPPRSRRNSLTSLFRRRASVDSVNPPGSSHTMPVSRNRNSFAASNRDPSVSTEPSNPFQRRPTILTKKGIAQDGGYINLEDGLDICLNLEVSQKDPAGITTPYRLLVPALYYTEPDAGVVQKERRKSRMGSVFGVFGGKRRHRTVGDDGYSHSGSDADDRSDASSEMGEVDEEERTRQRYKVGPRILIPGISKKRTNTAPASPGYANTPAAEGVDRDRSVSTPHAQTAQHDETLNKLTSASTAASSAAQDRRSSAPLTSGLLTRSGPQHTVSQSQRLSQIPQPQQHPPSLVPGGGPSRVPIAAHNSSHKSQLPTPSVGGPVAMNQTPRLPPMNPDPEPKVQRRSMGGILGQHRDSKFEHEAHVLAHTPSNPTPRHKKRESYPPHPAIVGGGPGSPYAKPGGKYDTNTNTASGGDYFSSGGGRGGGGQHGHGSTHTHHSHAHTGTGADTNSGNAGVGARYLGGGRYADEEDSLSVSELGPGEGAYSDDGYSDGGVSEHSFVKPKGKSKWKIWK
ncbi:hypothetical protein BCR34DRAFT_607526 [Clohesyomyces aquaticus]|uniref:PhoD-like phosphatase domain-containing protein n=1 Tax=Clohesyomyces aquaticus TaxID=1231657 RepID=A0A1Y1YFG5_9PLEO|nr:hypothetical protein BCR34DRAFT_607526 [Clohesyomyces aquaticus]